MRQKSGEVYCAARYCAALPVVVMVLRLARTPNFFALAKQPVVKVKRGALGSSWWMVDSRWRTVRGGSLAQMTCEMHEKARA